MQHNNWGIVGIQYANTCIQRRSRWPSLSVLISYVPFAFLPHWLGSKRSTWCASPRRDSTSIPRSKLRIVLFFDIASYKNRRRDFSDVVSWNKRNQWRGWFAAIMWLITLDDVTYCSSVTRRQHGNLSELSVAIWARASDFWLKRPPKTRHLFALSVIPGADSQQMTVRVRVRQVAADRR